MLDEEQLCVCSRLDDVVGFLGRRGGREREAKR